MVDRHALPGRRRKKRIGATKRDKKRADEIAKKIDVALALGTFRPGPERAFPCDLEVRRWLKTYTPTLKPSYVTLCEGLIENHLAPHFGSRDLREIREGDVLEFVRAKQSAGLSPGTIRNALSTLRRVYSLLGREGALSNNPTARSSEN